MYTALATVALMIASAVGMAMVPFYLFRVKIKGKTALNHIGNHAIVGSLNLLDKLDILHGNFVHVLQILLRNIAIIAIEHVRLVDLRSTILESLCISQAGSTSEPEVSGNKGNQEGDVHVKAVHNKPGNKPAVQDISGDEEILFRTFRHHPGGRPKGMNPALFIRKRTKKDLTSTTWMICRTQNVLALLSTVTFAQQTEKERKGS
jgi:hypothetical protein